MTLQIRGIHQDRDQPLAVVSYWTIFGELNLLINDTRSNNQGYGCGKL